MIREVVSQRRMPPWYAANGDLTFANDCRLSAHELEQIVTWIDQGAPEGDPAQAPEPRAFVDGWTEQPDEIIPMAETPVRVPATGPAFIERYLIKPGWKEGRWIKSVECRPDAREAVHHFAIFVVAPSEDPMEHWARRFIDILYGYSPGMSGMFLPNGMAKYIPPGAHFLFELHYVPTGEECLDLSSVGVRFEEPERVTHIVRTHLVVNELPLKIRPYDPDAIVDGEYTFATDSKLIGMTGHAHVRCKSFQFNATYPDGRKQSLLTIPDYDMFWQQFYLLKDLHPLPKGTVVECVAHYDNSAKNPRNPDPSIMVLDGDTDIFQDEMMNGFLIVAEKKPSVLPTIADAQNLMPWYKLVYIIILTVGIPLTVAALLLLLLVLGAVYYSVRWLVFRKAA